MLTHTLTGEVAAPLRQIQEIVPCEPDMARCQGHAHLPAVLMHRGACVPVMDLGALLNLPTPEVTADTSVLLFASAGESVGFAVPKLRSIESSDWEPSPLAHAASLTGTHRRPKAPVAPPLRKGVLKFTLHMPKCLKG